MKNSIRSKEGESRMFNNYSISVFESETDVRELSESEIIEKENALASALIDILKRLGLQSLKIRELQKAGFMVKWKNGQDLGFDMLPMLIRDCTRGNCACRLSGDNFYAYIGEDNCLYVGCALVFSFGLYNFVAIIINQYLGHKFSIISLLLGALLMFISIQLLK